MDDDDLPEPPIGAQWLAKVEELDRAWRATQPVGDLIVRIEPGAEAPTGVEFTLIIHPAERRLCEERRVRQASASARDDPLVVEPGLLVGHYLVVVKVAGHRPQVQQVDVGEAGATLVLGERFEPSADPAHDAIVVRVGERHRDIPLLGQLLASAGLLSAADADSNQLTSAMSEALRSFQEQADVPASGDLTVDTVLAFLTPTCRHLGTESPAPVVRPVPPSPEEDDPWRSIAAKSQPTGRYGNDPFSFTNDRYGTQTNVWGEQRRISYRFNGPVEDITGPGAWSPVVLALQTWQSVLPITFSESTGESADLDFRFIGDDDPAYPFDGTGVLATCTDTYAHANPNPNPGRGTPTLIEFDAENWWTPNFLYRIALHEIGHALGLGHSGWSSATMYPHAHRDMGSLKEVDVRGARTLFPLERVRRNETRIICPLNVALGGPGTVTRTIDLGVAKRFVAWTMITSIDSYGEFDGDNLITSDVFAVDAIRTKNQVWSAHGDEEDVGYLGSRGGPCNAYRGSVIRTGRRITFRMSVEHAADLQAAGYGIVLILDER